MRTMIRSEERVQFLTDILCGAIENYGYGWFDVHEYQWDGEDAANPYAVVSDKEDTGGEELFRIDLDLIAKGLGVIKRAKPSEVADGRDEAGSFLVNAETGERLYVGSEMRANIMLADRTNGDDGDLDVVDYLAIVECGLFGRVVYA